VKVLLVGGGGREHALAWKIAQSPMVDTVFAAPGNPGIARLASCVDISVDSHDELVAFARAFVTSSSTVRSCVAKPFTVSTRFGTRSARRW